MLSKSNTWRESESYRKSVSQADRAWSSQRANSAAWLDTPVYNGDTAWVGTERPENRRLSPEGCQGGMPRLVGVPSGLQSPDPGRGVLQTSRRGTGRSLPGNSEYAERHPGSGRHTTRRKRSGRLHRNPATDLRKFAGMCSGVRLCRHSIVTDFGLAMGPFVTGLVDRHHDDLVARTD